MERTIIENIMNNISDALFVVDKHGKIIYVNSAMVQLLGYSKQEAETMDTYQMYRTGITDIHIFQKVLNTKRAVTCCQQLKRNDGSFAANLLITQTPIFDARGEIIYSVGIMREIERLYKIFQQKKENNGTFYSKPRSTHWQKNVPIFQSVKIAHLMTIVKQLALTDAPLLIQGESGVGKEVFANYIHAHSTRRDKKLIVINCAAMPENLLESELFGYEKGSFTGAQAKGKVGLVAAAHEGTLFLDEVNSLPLSLQGKLLRVLEQKTVRKIGAIEDQNIDFRLLAATNTNLMELVQEKKFRLDLYYRLNVCPILIPPLRERPADIPPLCEAFLDHYATKYGLRKYFSPTVYEKLCRHTWPGNVRELKNFVERIVLMTDTGTIQIDDIDSSLLSAPDTFLLPFNSEGQPTLDNEPLQEEPSIYKEGKTLKELVHIYEQRLIEEAVERHGSYSKAAKALGTTKNTLLRKNRNR